tara:strand:- start:5330 stop:7075 length:1746 start_codon:yes stop_codon:yes gene_type:complete
MPYVGNPLADAFSSREKQDLTGQSGTSFTLTHAVSHANDLSVYINHVRQEPTTAYSVNGTTLTTTGSVASTDDFYIIYDELAVQSISHPTDQALTATSGTFTSGLVGTTATFSGAISGTTGTFSGDITANGNIAGDNSTNITGIAGVTATSLTGTLQTAAQPNVTSVGTLTGLTTSGAIDVQGNEIILDDDGDTSITADTDDQIDLKVGGTDTVVVKPDVVEIKGSHPDLKLMDTDDNNYGGLFYNNGSMTLATDHDATGATGVIKFAIDSTERVAINNNGQLQFKTSANDRTALYFMDPDNSNYGVCGFERATYNGGTNIWYTQNSTHFAIKTSSVIGFFMKHDTRQVVLSRNGSTSPFNTTTQLTVSPDYNNSKGGIGIYTYAYYSGIPAITIYNNDTNNGRNMEDILFRRNSSTQGYIRITGANGVNYYSASDYRLKEDNKEITDAIGQVKKLKPYNFKWKNSGDREDGFFAHEVGEVFDYAVDGKKDAVVTKKNVVLNKEGIAIADNIEKEDWEKRKADSDNEDNSPIGETTYPTDSTWQEEFEDIKPQVLDNSKLVPILTAALQEAIKRIEALESK